MSQAIRHSVPKKTHAIDEFAVDPWFVAGVVSVITIGLVMVASASIAISARTSGSEWHYLWRQFGAVAIGAAFGAWVLRTPLETIERISATSLVVATGLMMAVLIPGIGREVNGSMRWISLGPLTMQASEPAKLAVIVYVAGYLVRHQKQVRTEFLGFIKPIAVVTLVAGLLLLEPDFGAAVVIFSTVLAMLFLGGVPFMRFAAWGGVAVAALASLAILAPYRMQRLLAFRDPWSDPYNTGFQLTQALIAFGRGEWFGVGLGNSVQKLFYLPEVHTDFIFAVIGEELGLAGACAVIALFWFLLVRTLRVGGAAEESGQLYGAYVAYGVGILVAVEAFINIGVNLGILPTKGLTLPMISYGSNSMVMLCVAVALVLRVSYESRMAQRTVSLSVGRQYGG